MYLVYLEYWTLNLKPLIIYTFSKVTPNASLAIGEIIAKGLFHQPSTLPGEQSLLVHHRSPSLLTKMLLKQESLLHQRLTDRALKLSPPPAVGLVQGLGFRV